MKKKTEKEVEVKQCSGSKRRFKTTILSTIFTDLPTSLPGGWLGGGWGGGVWMEEEGGGGTKTLRDRSLRGCSDNADHSDQR